MTSSKHTGKRVATIRLGSIKHPDRWMLLADELQLSEAKCRKYFEFGEYASIELDVDEDLNIVGGRILPVKR